MIARQMPWRPGQNANFPVSYYVRWLIFPRKISRKFHFFLIIIAFCVPQLHLGQIFCHLLIALGLRGAGEENLSFILLWDSWILYFSTSFFFYTVLHLNIFQVNILIIATVKIWGESWIFNSEISRIAQPQTPDTPSFGWVLLSAGSTLYFLHTTLSHVGILF